MLRPSVAVFNRLAVATLLAASLVGGATVATRIVRSDSCAVPTDGLDGTGRLFVARRTMACHDFEAGRITKREYHEAIARLDAVLVQKAPVSEMWATSVLGFSSQYSADSWSAAQALGVPNVYPQHGDLAHAWASTLADGSAEWIELGYAEPRRVSAVEIFETFNPGAIATVQLVTASGKRITLRPQSQVSQSANKLVVETQCTSEPIAAVRIDLASQNVAGWNEIDAVGLVPCI